MAPIVVEEALTEPSGEAIRLSRGQLLSDRRYIRTGASFVAMERVPKAAVAKGDSARPPADSD